MRGPGFLNLVLALSNLVFTLSSLCAEALCFANWSGTGLEDRKVRKSDTILKFTFKGVSYQSLGKQYSSISR